MKYIKLALVVVALVVFVSFLKFRTSQNTHINEEATVPQNSSSNRKLAPKVKDRLSPNRFITEFVQSEALLANNPNDPSRLMEEVELLKNPELPENQAIEYMHAILNSCRGIANQGHYTTGDNIDVTTSLLGKNFRKVAYMPQNHPRINEQGELVDRWNSPYNFHFESSKSVTIRSYGPDRQPHTHDDIVQGIAGSE